MELETLEFESGAKWDIEPYPWQGFGFFGKLIAVALPLMAIGILILPFLDHSLLRRLARLPGLGNPVNWFVNNNGSWLAGIGLFLLWVGFLLYKRWRINSNEHLWVDAGCPQCQERELVRVSRHRKDRWYGLLSIPAFRYACRNCTWRGLRVARRHPQVVLAQEELIAASSLALEAAGLGLPTVPVAVDQILADPPSDQPEELTGVADTEDVGITLLEGEENQSHEPVHDTVAEEDALGEDIVAGTAANNHTEQPSDDDMDWLWRRLSEDK